MGNVFFLYKCLISGIEQNQSVVGECVVHPFFQLRLGQRCSRRIVRVAEVDDVNPLVRYLGNKVVFGGTGHVGHVAPFAVFFQYSGTATHYVAVYIYRVDGVCHSHAVIVAEDIAYVARIAFGSIVYEYFRRAKMNASRSIIMFDDRFNQKVISLLGTVSVEGTGICHLIHCPVHRLDASRWQWPGNVSDTQADDLLFRVRYPESIHLFSYV